MSQARYEVLKQKYDMGWITNDTLKGWVRLELKAKGRGITKTEYKKITGETYTA